MSYIALIRERCMTEAKNSSAKIREFKIQDKYKLRYTLVHNIHRYAYITCTQLAYRGISRIIDSRMIHRCGRFLEFSNSNTITTRTGTLTNFTQVKPIDLHQKYIDLFYVVIKIFNWPPQEKS